MSSVIIHTREKKKTCLVNLLYSKTIVHKCFFPWSIIISMCFLWIPISLFHIVVPCLGGSKQLKPESEQVCYKQQKAVTASFPISGQFITLGSRVNPSLRGAGLSNCCSSSPPVCWRWLQQQKSLRQGQIRTSSSHWVPAHRGESL